MNQSDQKASYTTLVGPFFLAGAFRVNPCPLVVAPSTTYKSCIAFLNINSDPIVSRFFALYRLFEIFCKSEKRNVQIGSSASKSSLFISASLLSLRLCGERTRAITSFQTIPR